MLCSIIQMKYIFLHELFGIREMGGCKKVFREWELTYKKYIYIKKNVKVVEFKYREEEIT